VRDLHQRVVDGVDQGVERMAVGAHQHVVGDVLGLEGDLAADEVVERDRRVRHPQPQHGVATLAAERRDLALGQLATVPVVAGRAPLGPGALAPLLELILRAVAVVGPAGLAQPPRHVGVDVEPLRLPVRAVGTADPRAIVPVHAQPVEHVEQQAVGLLGVA
jgi:hypothetical protein